MAKTVAPYGAWRSPISIELLASSGEPFFGYAIVAFDDDGLLWIESRAKEGGRAALVRDGRELAPPGFNARTRVHEYGGGAVWCGDGAILASSFDDGRMYRVENGAVTPLTPEPPAPNALRYADGVVSGGVVTCVRESHGASVVNELVTFPLAGGEPEVLERGRDFYSTPRRNRDGSRLAYLTWDDPLLPFIGCELVVDGEHVAGGPDESIFQPTWAPDGALWWVSDRDGWWNLYRDGEQVTRLEAELGTPQWVFGLRTYDFLADGRIACTVIDRGVHSYALLDPGSGDLERLDLPFTASTPYVTAHGTRFAVLAGTPTQAAGIHVIDADTGAYETVLQTWDGVLEPDSISVGRPIEFESNGRTAYAFYYPPTNAEFAAPEGELPPLRVGIHGGPTSQGLLSVTVAVQFLTSRGWGYVDVNYGGSTGFGREYRLLLHEQWGVVDLEDCIAAAQHLAAAGEADPARLSIAGGSAGGYTTLLALAVCDVFAAGTSAFGVADLLTFTEITHKFEGRYMDWLLGPLPAARDVYVERSPLTHADRISAPTMITQGLDDKIVPPSQAEQIVEALERNGVPYLYVPLEGEGHGYRRRESLVRTTSLALSFYGQVFGFEPADDVERAEIRNF